MKKILILTNSLDGFYRFRNEIIIKLLEKKNVIVFCAPTDIRENYYRKLGIHVIDIEINRRNVNLLKEINIFLTYRRIIKTFKPDIILTYTIKPNIYGGLAARFSNIPYYPNITGLGTSMEGKGLFKVLIIILYKIALKRAKTIFVQNEDNLSFIIKKGIKGFSYQLLPGSGVNTNYFTYLEYPTEEKFHFLFIGRIMKSKGIDYYLESSKYISQKYSNVVFHVIGDFEEDYKVKIIEYELKNFITYHGKVDDIRNFLKFSHATIQPSFHEGMSNVLLESAASGRPVIASNIPGCKEVFDENISGFSFKIKDQESLNKTIEKFLQLPHDQKKQMGIAGRNKVIKEFSREFVVKIYNDIIEKTEIKK